MDTTLQWAGSNGHLIVSKILHTLVHYYLVLSYDGYWALFSRKHITRPHPQGLLICSRFRNFYTEVALVTQELDIHTVKLCYNVLTPGVQFLEVVVETDLQSAIGGLSEEGRSNAGVCVCVGRGCKEESSCCTINQPETESDCTCRCLTNFQYLIPLNYLTMLMSCEIQHHSTHTTKTVASILCKQVNVS